MASSSVKCSGGFRLKMSGQESLGKMRRHLDCPNSGILYDIKFPSTISEYSDCFSENIRRVELLLVSWEPASKGPLIQKVVRLLNHLPRR